MQPNSGTTAMLLRADCNLGDYELLQSAKHSLQSRNADVRQPCSNKRAVQLGKFSLLLCQGLLGQLVAA